MSAQAVFPGMERLFRPAEKWNPRPGTLARVQNYLQGFGAHGKQIYARRKHIAARLRLALRTLDRYLAWLTRTGWLETLKRTARTAIREVKKVFASQHTGESTGESIEVTPGGPPKPDKKERSLPERVMKALERATDRIKRARNPAAYRQTIISSTLRLMRWERGQQARRPEEPPKPRPAGSPLEVLESLFGCVPKLKGIS